MMINIIVFVDIFAVTYTGTSTGSHVKDHMRGLKNKWSCGLRFEGVCKFADIFVNFNSYGSVKYVSGDLNKGNNCNRNPYFVSHLFICSASLIRQEWFYYILIFCQFVI